MYLKNRTMKYETELPLTNDDINNLKSESKKLKKAIVSTIFTISLSLAFGIGTYYFYGENSGVEFLTGYLVEQSLSIDNLIVFLMIFNYFKVPSDYQERVLNWGIIGAILMRGMMILLGIKMIQNFQILILLFAAILLCSSYKLLTEKNEDEDLSQNYILKISHYFIKSTTEYDGDRFFTKTKGISTATPLFMCLVCIEISDLVFAIDSIPAVLGISHDPFIVYTSNIFAIMGLRSLYTIIAKMISDLPYLKPAVALVLGFVGGKMIGEYFHKIIHNLLSLGIILFILFSGIVLSLFSSKFKKKTCN